MVPERALLARPSRPRAVHLPPRPRRRAAERLDVRVRRLRVDARRAERRVVPPFLLARPARPRLAQRAGAGSTSRRSCASGSTAASTASASTSRRPSSRRRTCTRWSSPIPRCGTRTGSRPSTSRNCTRSTVAGARSRTSTRASGCSSARSCYGTSEQLASSSRPDQLHLAFNFSLLHAPWDADAMRRVDRRTRGRRSRRSARADVGAREPRRDATATRYGGVERARAAARSCCSRCRAPSSSTRARSSGSRRSSCPTRRARTRSSSAPTASESGRDGCRVPMPWERRAARLRLHGGRPVAADAGRVERADGRGAGRARRLDALALPRARSRARPTGAFAWRESPPGTLVFERGSGLVCAVNVDGAPLELPEGELALASRPLRDRALPVDAAAWVILDG